MERKLRTLTIAEKLNLIESFEKSSLSNNPDEEMNDYFPTDIEVLNALKIGVHFQKVCTIQHSE